MIHIPLTKGFVAIIDDEDADLAKHKWCACVTKQGDAYAVRSVGTRKTKRTVYLHRVVEERKGPIPPKYEVDHENGDKLYCVRSNVRSVPPRINRKNVVGRPMLGVTKHTQTGRWVAQMRRPGKSPYLGIFATQDEALQARLAAEREEGIQPRRRLAHAA